MRHTLVVFITCCLCSLFSQEEYTRDYNIDVKIPQRLVRQSSDVSMQTYLDQKSKAVLKVERSRFSEFEAQLPVEAEIFYTEKQSDPNCFQVSKNELPLKVSSCYIISWKTHSRSKNRRNDQNCMAMIEVGGTTYDFHIALPTVNEKDLIPLFERILKSINEVN